MYLRFICYSRLCYVVSTNMRARRYTISDGKLVLYLQDAEEGGYVVTAPLDPELITEAETVEEAFRNAYDAAKSLRQSRRKLIRKLQSAGAA